MEIKNSLNGIIAGIGDKTINANVIPPEFDARIRNFFAGKNCILTGFEYNAGRNALSAGYCLAEGYVGGISKEIPNIIQGNYVYGVFSVLHDSESVDNFSIEVYDSELVAPRQDDILNVAGKYYFQIYPRTDNKEYPLKAEFSDKTNTVLADGELQDGVVCVTQKVGDKSKKVANNEFVYNQIKEELNEESYNGDGFTIVKRANFCILTIQKSLPYNNKETVLFQIPSKYRPQSIRTLLISGKTINTSGSDRPIYHNLTTAIKLYSDGNVTYINTTYNSNPATPIAASAMELITGYKIYDD